MINIETTVGQQGDLIRRLQHVMRQLQTLVRQQGGQIITLLQEIAGLRRNAGPGRAQGSGPMIASAVAGAANVGALVDRKRGRDEDESVGGTQVPEKKPRRWR